MSQNLLAQSHLFTRATYDFTLTKDQRQEVTHERAKAIALSFSMPIFPRNFRRAQHADCLDLTVEDILTCSEKFWNATLHPINVIDGAAAALWTIHVNLACGTLTQYAGSRPEIRELCRKILAFEMTYDVLAAYPPINAEPAFRAHYMLTEVGHGLDSQNIETTAELLPDGNFEIHTPNHRAAK